MGIDLRNIARGKGVSLDFRYETEQTKRAVIAALPSARLNEDQGFFLDSFFVP
jgi:hypothetical protein